MINKKCRKKDDGQIVIPISFEGSSYTCLDLKGATLYVNPDNLELLVAEQKEKRTISLISEKKEEVKEQQPVKQVVVEQPVVVPEQEKEEVKVVKKKQQRKKQEEKVVFSETQTIKKGITYDTLEDFK